MTALPNPGTPAVRPPVVDDGGAVPRPRWRAKWLLAVAIASYALFWWLARRVGLAEEYGFDGSLLLARGAFANVLLAGVLTLGAVVVGTLLAGNVRPDAGLFAAAVGLLALGNRGRSMVEVLHDAGGARGTYLMLALELVILFAVLAAGWWLLFVLQRVGRLQPDNVRDGLHDIDDQPAGAGWSALLTHVGVMAVVVVLLAQTEERKQVLAAIGIGSFCGAFFPYWQRGAYPSAWYLLGPLVVGVVGYVLAFALIPAGALALGRPGFAGGFLGALGRPLPLDYASMGTIGALIGYWMRRKSVHERETLAAHG